MLPRLKAVLQGFQKCSCIGDTEESTATTTVNHPDTNQTNPAIITGVPAAVPVAKSLGTGNFTETGETEQLPKSELNMKPATLIDTSLSEVIDNKAPGGGTVVPHVLDPEQYDTVPFPVIKAYELSLSELEDATLDMLPVSTSCTFRLLDCRRFGKQCKLVIYETHDIPRVGYMTVSYPWVGIVCNERVPPEDRTFMVAHGASGSSGDPISTSILSRICFLATTEDMDFLWLDRLCIRQGDPIDHKWQIDRMCNIFRLCQVCVVFPGGLQRLANIYEETPWITRAWTLAEVLAAPKAQIVTEFAPTSLDQFLLGATDPLYGMRLFGRHRANHRSLLVDALSLRYQHMSDKQKYYRNLSIWKCALARTASRNEDLLPSVIALFGTPEDSETLETVITRFKEGIRTLNSSELCVIAFRDAVLFSGQNVSPQWQELISSIAPTLPVGERSSLRISQPRVIRLHSEWDGFPISKAYEITLSELENTVHDISSVSTSCTFRLLDCKRYIEEQTIAIYETPGIPEIRYAAVSYPWVGNPCHYFVPNSGKSFKVMQDAGRLGDPINFEMIRLSCLLAIQEGADFLWVDRLCIRQMDNKDKAWQISRMCDVYRRCQLCIIIPGGLQRLIGLDEETPWATRMWTLQEALVPPKGLILYSADSDSIKSHAKTLSSVDSDLGIFYSPLEDLLPTTMAKKDVGVRLFGHVSHGYALLLRDALSLRGQSVSDEQKYQRYLATWRSAVTRSSDRPQDLLLSTMGLFDISIPEGEQRSSATVITAFVNEFQQQGIMDVRVVAFRDAVRRADVAVTSQWRQLIEECDRSLPLLPNGLAPIPGHDLALDRAGQLVAHDNSKRQLFLGSALLLQGAEHSLHPCKIVVSSSGSFTCLLPYGGQEKEHDGRWELNPFLPDQMEWVAASRGAVPNGRTPVEGGYEKDVQYHRQRSLYYALATVTDSQGHLQRVPGKTGNHLGGCCFGLDGKENFVRENYMILCWKESAKTGQTAKIDSKIDDETFWSRPNLPAVSFPGIRADR
ncbi:hypothetical protein Moror_4337 [Moniliophthora roreri MCA 2997]|uniref:Heterokaryon incompatibility domain-containing protein n=1 Tax=Moniliophthora roreri (strain MCA 2997) TaxID=1381753 RepID=V2YLS7_MONRO|nr:hypothetical protein Moror_4337 [Moniliophthora roreri MCA 2997]